MSGDGEFDLIERMVEALGDTTTGPGVVAGPGDDAAVLAAPPGCELVVSTDTQVARRHYPQGANPGNIGYRSMAVATSDLAAMGAQPAWATVSLTTPQLAGDWARGFALGIAEAARCFRLAVVGGNLARGPQSVSVTVCGHVPVGEAILRSTAKPGDLAYVSGCIGGAGLALRDLVELAACEPARLVAGSKESRYWRPSPRLDLGIGLRGLASAAIDVSDGLAADLDHLCKASGVRCEVDLQRVPVFRGCEPLAAIGAGDDYELAFTAPTSQRAAIAALAERTGVSLAPIGEVLEGTPFRTRWRDGGAVLDAPVGGFRHF